MKSLAVDHLAMLAVALAGVAWGLFWIPLRALDGAGVTGVWAIVLFYVVPALLLLPFFVARRRQLLSGGWPLHLAGVLSGVSLVLYAGAFVFTDVVRALLFYYLTPLWSTLLARIVIGEAITGLRWTTIALASAGLLLILNVDTGFDISLRPGDWMGLAAGFVWAIAAVCMKSDASGNGLDFTLVYFAWGSIAALLMIVLPLEGSESLPDWEAIRDVLPWFLPVALLLVIPPALAIMWGATLLSPGLLAILFMTEVSVGTITAAILTDEPFGARELAGVLLITSAGILEPARALLRRDDLKTSAMQECTATD